MDVEKQDAYERALARAKRKLAELPIPAGNRRAVLEFSDSCFSQGLSSRRVLKYVYTLGKIAGWLAKDFQQVTRADIEQLAARIERSDYAEWTKHDYRVALKKFFRWLRKSEDGYPPEVKWLRTTLRQHRAKLPEELLRPREVQDLVTAALTVRDKALIAMLYESGCRIGELLGLQVRQLQPHRHGLQVTVTGKKGPRRLLLIACAPYLTAWLNTHPRRQEPQAPLWVTEDYHARRLSYTRACTILRTAARRAGVNKPVNPHNFRHSRATYLAQHLTEAQMNAYLGWVQGSDMPSTYVHLSGRDVDEALLKLNHIEVADDRQRPEEFSLKRCFRCGRENPPGDTFCRRCGAVLDEATARDLMKRHLERRRADEVMDQLLEDAEFRTLLARKLGELAQDRKTG